MLPAVTGFVSTFDKTSGWRGPLFAAGLNNLVKVTGTPGPPGRWYFRNLFRSNSLGTGISPPNTCRMRNLAIFAALLVSALAAVSSAQDNRVFDWTPANSETIPPEPATLPAR